MLTSRRPPASHSRSSRARLLLSLGAFVLALLSEASPAWARQEYYDALVDTGTCADCRLCHTTSVGSAATLDASKPFMSTMLLGGRLGGLPDVNSDSDMDGFTDLVELQEFGDPNDPTVTPGNFECPGAEYGCARIARPAPDGGASAAAGLVGLLLWVGTRRRARSTRR